MKRFVSVFPPAFSTTYIKATNELSESAWQATDPTKNLYGDEAGNSWLTGTYPGGNNMNTRFHIDLGTPIIITKIYYVNSLVFYDYDSTWHGGEGVKAFTFWGSNSATAFTTLTYATDTDWTQLTTDISQMLYHVEANQPDDRYVLVTNSTAYRYYAFKFSGNWGTTLGGSYQMGIRRIELQKEVDVSEITASSIQNISQIHI